MLYAPNQRVPDETVRGEGYLPDPEVWTIHSDWYEQAWETNFREFVFRTPTETSQRKQQSITEIADKTEDDAVTTENEVVKTTTVKNTE